MLKHLIQFLTLAGTFLGGNLSHNACAGDNPIFNVPPDKALISGGTDQVMHSRNLVGYHHNSTQMSNADNCEFQPSCEDDDDRYTSAQINNADNYEFQPYFEDDDDDTDAASEYYLDEDLQELFRVNYIPGIDNDSIIREIFQGQSIDRQLIVRKLLDDLQGQNQTIKLKIAQALREFLVNFKKFVKAEVLPDIFLSEKNPFIYLLQNPSIENILANPNHLREYVEYYINGLIANGSAPTPTSLADLIAIATAYHCYIDFYMLENGILKRKRSGGIHAANNISILVILDKKHAYCNRYYLLEKVHYSKPDYEIGNFISALARENCDTALVKALIRIPHISITDFDQNRRSSLLIAFQKLLDSKTNEERQNYTEIIQLLLARLIEEPDAASLINATFNEPSTLKKDGMTLTNTILHLIAIQCFKPIGTEIQTENFIVLILKSLLAHPGLDVTIRNDKHRTAFTIAMMAINRINAESLQGHFLRHKCFSAERDLKILGGCLNLSKANWILDYTMNPTFAMTLQGITHTALSTYFLLECLKQFINDGYLSNNLVNPLNELIKQWESNALNDADKLADAINKGSNCSFCICYDPKIEQLGHVMCISIFPSKKLLAITNLGGCINLLTGRVGNNPIPGTRLFIMNDKMLTQLKSPNIIKNILKCDLDTICRLFKLESLGILKAHGQEVGNCAYVHIQQMIADHILMSLLDKTSLKELFKMSQEFSDGLPILTVSGDLNSELLEVKQLFAALNEIEAAETFFLLQAIKAFFQYEPYLNRPPVNLMGEINGEQNYLAILNLCKSKVADYLLLITKRDLPREIRQKLKLVCVEIEELLKKRISLFNEQ